MAGRSSGRLFRQVHRIFNLGAVGTLTDAQLLDWFVSRRDEAAEAAFEELISRHGPMVFRVCRSILRDRHDAEDAFQATFLVLAHRARAIRRSSSVASWLFGVAHRDSARARSRAARQRALDRESADRTAVARVPSTADPDWEILHQEVDRLPERLRAPVVLCYLEGLTYAAAAYQLRLSEGAFRGRLAQARRRLMRRLTARGVTVPAGLLLAVATTDWSARAAVPTALALSTTRIALGFVAGSTATVLARGVLRTMLLNRIKVAMVLLFLSVGGGYRLWHASGAGIDDKGQAPAGSRPTVRKPAVPSPGPQPQTLASSVRFTGSVTVEGTGQPVAAAKLRILIGGAGSQMEKAVETGADGRFAADLPTGNVRVWLSDLPAGYVVSGVQQVMEDLELRADQPVIHREYRARPGTIWSFQFLRGSDRRPFRGSVSTISTAMAPLGPSRAEADDRGRALLTLATEGGWGELGIQESSPLSSSEIQTGILRLRLEWEPGFRPDELAEISRLEGADRRFRLIDADAKSAVLQATDLIEPVKEDGKLVITMTVPHRDAKDFGALTGEILDERGRPIAGAHVAVSTGRMIREPHEMHHQATTDPKGRYRLRDIPRRAIDGKPLEVRLTVTREGFVGVESAPLTLMEGAPEKPQVVDPIRLDRGVSLGGFVVDHRGQPVVGAFVRSNQPDIQGGAVGTPRTVQTDAEGRFHIDGLHRGVVGLFVFHGRFLTSGTYLADGAPEAIRIRLPDPASERAPEMGAPPPDPIAVGQPAPEWQVGPWSDGRVRKLADERGKVVVLYFWGMSFWPSVGVLPAMGELMTRLQPRDVEFLAIHNAERDEEVAREQGRKVLAFKGAALIMAIDQSRVRGHARGKSLQRYGGQGFPLPIIIVIDRTGEIAYRSDTGSGDRNLSAVFMEMARNPRTMTEQKAIEQVKRTLAEEVEKALEKPWVGRPS